MYTKRGIHDPVIRNFIYSTSFSGFYPAGKTKYIKNMRANAGPEKALFVCLMIHFQVCTESYFFMILICCEFIFHLFAMVIHTCKTREN